MHSLVLSSNSSCARAGNRESRRILKDRPPLLSGLKGQIASLLIVMALVVGASIGYFGNTAAPRTTTETVIRTYTVTTTLAGESNVERCIVTEYLLWAIGELTGPTILGSSTQSYPVQTYQTSTSAEQTVGFETTTTAPYAGTLAGALAIWNSTTCTYISG